ncbi:MAG: hypothetical protein E4H23_01780 [Chrysiogenales bacterium]|nr:MAG: hypothetical protein E4H23_01780 [Chrysiogenales bacterium]
MKLKRLVVFLLAPALLAIAVLSYIFLSSAKKPNIILITVDALRADYLGAYGNANDTSPQIDAFARESLVFTNAYCTVPKTSASFASLMTGLHPFFHQTSPIKDFLREENLTLAEFLSKNDYETAAIVENANLSKFFKFDQGFGSYMEVWKRVDGKAAATPFITDATSKFLNGKHSQPFFLWVHYIDTHAPYLPPAELVRYDETRKGRDISQIEKKIVIGSKIEKEKILNGYSDENYFIALYEGCIRYVDGEIGKILEIIKRRYLDNTVVIISSDHGEELGEHNLFFDHGALTFQSSTRVPLIVSIPGRKKARIDRPVSLMDVFPTVCEDILHKRIPTTIQGISLFKEAAGRKLHIYGQSSHAIIAGGRSFIEIKQHFADRLDIPTRYCFDYQVDAAEKHNLLPDSLSLFLLNNNLYNNYIAKNKYPVRKRGHRELSEKDLESLKALGYIN